MLRLMLLRHAKSAYPVGVGDHERPLARRGRRVAPLIGGYMARHGLLPDLAVVSTARRAQETWELARTAFEQDVAQRDERRIYEAPVSAIIGVIRETKAGASTLLLVGHNPGFEDTARELVGEGNEPDLTRLRRKYPTAGLAVIDFGVKRWHDVTTGSGRLERFVTPKTIDV